MTAYASFEEFVASRDQGAGSWDNPAMRECWDAAKAAGYLEAVHNHDNCKIHGYCGDCICGGAAREQEDWAHVGS